MIRCFQDKGWKLIDTKNIHGKNGILQNDNNQYDFINDLPKTERTRSEL